MCERRQSQELSPSDLPTQPQVSPKELPAQLYSVYRNLSLAFKHGNGKKGASPCMLSLLPHPKHTLLSKEAKLPAELPQGTPWASGAQI